MINIFYSRNTLMMTVSNKCSHFIWNWIENRCLRVTWYEIWWGMEGTLNEYKLHLILVKRVWVYHPKHLINWVLSPTTHLSLLTIMNTKSWRNDFRTVQCTNHVDTRNKLNFNIVLVYSVHFVCTSFLYLVSLSSRFEGKFPHQITTVIVITSKKSLQGMGYSV